MFQFFLTFVRLRLDFLQEIFTPEKSKVDYCNPRSMHALQLCYSFLNFLLVRQLYLDISQLFEYPKIFRKS